VTGGWLTDAEARNFSATKSIIWQDLTSAVKLDEV
jgi:hypothetical protein